MCIYIYISKIIKRYQKYINLHHKLPQFFLVDLPHPPRLGRHLRRAPALPVGHEVFTAEVVGLDLLDPVEPGWGFLGMENPWKSHRILWLING